MAKSEIDLEVTEKMVSFNLRKMRKDTVYLFNWKGETWGVKRVKGELVFSRSTYAAKE